MFQQVPFKITGTPISSNSVSHKITELTWLQENLMLFSSTILMVQICLRHLNLSRFNHQQLQANLSPMSASGRSWLRSWMKRMEASSLQPLYCTQQSIAALRQFKNSIIRVRNRPIRLSRILSLWPQLSAWKKRLKRTTAESRSSKREWWILYPRSQQVLKPADLLVLKPASH